MRVLPLFLLAGCARLGDVPDEFVESAYLQNLDTNGFVAVAGAIGGDAILVWTTPDGNTGAMPVSVSGGAVGVIFEATADLDPNADVTLDLSDADEGLKVEDLLGTYHGSGWNFTLGLGGAGHNLKNGSGVVLNDEHFTAGFGIEGGWEWLRVREGGHEDGLDDDWTDDTGEPEETGDTDDTDDTEDTGPDTNIPDTGFDPPSGGSCDRGNGCNNNGCDIDLGLDDACGCSSVGMIHAPILASMLLAIRRRRHHTPTAVPPAQT